MSLHAQGGRIFVGDAQESVHLFKYKKSDNSLYCFADDAAPRYLTAVLPLDYDTIVGADKFGNAFVARLPPDVSAQVRRGRGRAWGTGEGAGGGWVRGRGRGGGRGKEKVCCRGRGAAVAGRSSAGVQRLGWRGEEGKGGRREGGAQGDEGGC